MSTTQYVSKVSTANTEFAMTVLGLVDDLADSIADADDGHAAAMDMMKFLYGNGQ